MTSKRIKWLDFAKGFTIFFVILAHCGSSFLKNSSGLSSDIIKIVLYASFTFVMPMFFAISGYLYKHVNSLPNYLLLIYKKATSLLIPYFIFSILFTFRGLLEHKVNSPFDFLEGFKYSSYLWFLISLFVIFIIVGLLDLFKVKPIIQFIIFIILTLLQPDFWLMFNNVHMKFNIIYCTISYSLFFFMGIIIRHVYNKYNIHIKHVKWFSLISIIIWGILLFIQSCYTNPIYQTDFITITDIFTKILIVLIAFIIISNMKLNNVSTYVCYYGKYTLIIYLIHIPILDVLFHIFVLPFFNKIKMFISSGLFVSLIYILLYIIAIFIVTVLSIYSYYLSKRYKLISFIFYPRKYITPIFNKTNLGKFLNK